jgi:hypothetical protein
MGKTKIPAPVDTTAGTAMYKLAVLHEADLDPRLPAGTIAGLAASLTTLGANPNPAPAPTPSTPATPAPATPPTLADAAAQVVTLVSAVHDALQGARATPDVRKAYGVSGKTPTKEASALFKDGGKIVAAAQADPAEALSYGILPADVTALSQALGQLTAAETAAKGGAAAAGTTGKERRAAETAMHEAVARIAGAGVLAFATNAAVRAQFAALKPARA